MSDPTKLLITRRRTKPHRLFDQLANVRGPLDAAARGRLCAVLARPSRETWEQAYALVLTPGGLTLWAAVCYVDPRFPSRRPFRRVPDPLTLVRALRAATSGRATLHAVLARRLAPKGP